MLLKSQPFYFVPLKYTPAPAPTPGSHRLRLKAARVLLVMAIARCHQLVPLALQDGRLQACSSVLGSRVSVFHCAFFSWVLLCCLLCLKQHLLPQMPSPVHSWSLCAQPCRLPQVQRAASLSLHPRALPRAWPTAGGPAASDVGVVPCRLRVSVIALGSSNPFSFSVPLCKCPPTRVTVVTR